MIEATSTPNTKVYVCFFPTDIHQDDALDMFKKFGTISTFQLYRRKDGFTYAHITFEQLESAQKAIQEMNKKRIEDKVLKVSFAAPNCIPKKKKLQQKKEEKKALEALKPSKGPEHEVQKSYLKTGNKNLDQKVSELDKSEEKLLYLTKIELALRKILIMKNEIMQKQQAKNLKKKVQEVQEKKEQPKIAIEDLKVFQSWLKKNTDFDANHLDITQEYSEDKIFIPFD